ncbi:hypothetical protein D3C73_1242370 [compost metagenome]
MNFSAPSPWPSSTSSTSKGSSNGIGTLQQAASTATRLAAQSCFLWCSAKRRICAQLSRSGTAAGFPGTGSGEPGRSSTGGLL